MKHRLKCIPSDMGFVCPSCNKITRDEPKTLGERFNWQEGCAACSDEINNQEENNQ